MLLKDHLLNSQIIDSEEWGIYVHQIYVKNKEKNSFMEGTFFPLSFGNTPLASCMCPIFTFPLPFLILARITLFTFTSIGDTLWACHTFLLPGTSKFFKVNGIWLLFVKNLTPQYKISQTVKLL